MGMNGCTEKVYDTGGGLLYWTGRRGWVESIVGDVGRPPDFVRHSQLDRESHHRWPVNDRKEHGEEFIVYEMAFYYELPQLGRASSRLFHFQSVSLPP